MSRSDLGGLAVLGTLVLYTAFFLLFRGRVKPVVEWSVLLASVAVLAAALGYGYGPASALLPGLVFLCGIALFLRAIRGDR